MVSPFLNILDLCWGGLEKTIELDIWSNPHQSIRLNLVQLDEFRGFGTISMSINAYEQLFKVSGTKNDSLSLHIQYHLPSKYFVIRAITMRT